MKIKNIIGLAVIGGLVYLAYWYSKYKAAGGDNGYNGTFYQYLTYS